MSIINMISSALGGASYEGGGSRIMNFNEKTAIVQTALAKKKEITPHYDFMFAAQLPFLDINPPFPSGAKISPIPSSEYDENPYDPTEVNHRIYTINAPMPSFETIRNTGQDKPWMSAGKSEIGTMSMTIDEMIDFRTMMYFRKWQSMVRNDDGSFNVPHYYKRDIIVVYLGAAKTESHIAIYSGCFPTTIGDISHNYDTADVAQYEVTFSVDDVKHIFIKVDETKRKLEVLDKHLPKLGVKNKGQWSALQNALLGVGIGLVT